MFIKDNLGMKYISSNISIPQIPPLTNKSIVTIHTFLSLRNIFIKVPFQKFEVDKFIKDFSIFCLTCMYYLFIKYYYLNITLVKGKFYLIFFSATY